MISVFNQLINFDNSVNFNVSESGILAGFSGDISIAS
jgi:hypothetical protein